MKRLFIAEKPDMGRKIAGVLGKGGKSQPGFVQVGNDYVTWCIGHLLEQCPPGEYNPAWDKWKMDQLPMIPEAWKLKVSGDKGKQVKIIKELLGEVDEVVNAGDPGREGQLIVDELLVFLKNKKPVGRLLLQSLDPKSIQKALNNIEDNKKYLPLYQAGLGRQRADWLIGMNMTQAYTLIGQSVGRKGVLSVGRVQSPTLAMVVKRDEEIENFVPKTYYTIYGDFLTKNKEPLSAKWAPNDAQKDQKWLDETKILDKNVAEGIVNKVKGKEGEIVVFEQNRVQEKPPLPFELSDLQIYGSAKWGMSALEVLETCQKLYENGYLSYPRSDCSYLPENQFPDSPDVISAIGNQPEFVGLAPKADSSLKSQAWNDAKLGEHHGIIPTRETASFSNENERKLYIACAQRYLAQFYPDAELDKTKIVIEVEEELFVAQGSILVFPGWKEIFGMDAFDPKKAKPAKKKKGKDDEEDAEEEDENFNSELPKVSKNEKADCTNAALEEKQTKPPARYTQGSLLEAMKKSYLQVEDPEMKKRLKESKGIGTSATRANIIETLLKRGLLIPQGKKQILSSESGRALIKMLPSKLVDPGLTAVWEMALDQVAQGKLNFDHFYTKQTGWLTTLTANAKVGYKAPLYQSNPNRPPPVTGKTCPTCKKGTLMLREAKTGKNAGGKFWGCNNYPACKHTEQHDPNQK